MLADYYINFGGLITSSKKIHPIKFLLPKCFTVHAEVQLFHVQT